MGSSQISEHQDTHRQTVNDLHADQQTEKLGQRIDFLSHLPEGLIPLILGSCDLTDMLNVIKVSKTWRKRALQAPFLDLFGCIHDSTEGDTEPTLEMLLPLSDKIGTLNIVDLGVDGFTKLGQSVIAGRFLHLTSIYMREFNDIGDVNLFIRALSQLRDTLEEMEIYCNERVTLPFLDILTASRSLKLFTYCSPSHCVDDMPEIIPCLELLSLNINVNFIPFDLFGALIRSCGRALLSVSISGCTPEIISVINSECSTILYLSFCALPVSLSLEASKKLHNDGASGLRSFTLKDVQISTVVPLFAKHHQTLTNAEITFSDKEGLLDQVDPSVIDILDAIPALPRLESIELQNYPNNIDVPLEKLVAQCKRLKTFIFGCRNGESPEVIQAAARSLDHLEMLLVRKHADIASVIPLYNAIANSGNLTLTKIEIDSCKGIIGKALVTLSGIKSMEQLALHNIPQLTTSELDCFLRSLLDHNLVDLYATQVPAFTDETLRILCEISSLQYVTIDGVTADVDEEKRIGYHMLLEKLPNAYCTFTSRT